ncbi:MAG: DUF4349 domain-containing protein [Polyangiaceae bacterium]|nr:DUF4349 domain-containing protein [Polyangiaceae bacterium]
MAPRSALPVVILVVLASMVSGCKREADAGAAPAASAAPADPIAGASRVVRKVVRNADLAMTVTSPGAAQREASRIAEEHGGYLASAESLSAASEDGEEPGSVRVTLRVSADRLDAALEGLRKLGKHMGHENLSSRDVTDEWVDLEARIKTQKKLEEQYLEILKNATRVDDLLSVQKQLAEVRGEIEKAEGKKRLLDTQISLSTITVTFQGERQLVAFSTGAFGRAAKRASADTVNVGAGIVIGGIRLAGVLVPVFLLVLLPGFLLGRLALRRMLRAAA